MANRAGSDALPIVDCCLHNAPAYSIDLLEYLSAGWRDYMVSHMTPEWQDHLAGRGPRPDLEALVPYGQAPGHDAVDPYIWPEVGYLNPNGDKLPESITDDGTAIGSDYEAVCRYLDDNSISRAVLCHDKAMLTPALPMPNLTIELARAFNDWMIDRWLSGPDRRLYGLILVPNQVPEAAVAEIQRVGQQERMVGILMGVSGLDKPLGHPVYHPIYAAAAEAELPIVTHAGTERVIDSLAYPTAAGMPAMVGEYRALRDQAQSAHVLNLITQGVFEKFPGLRALVLGAGVTWVAPFLWRFDTEISGLRRDAPWLKQLPSDYFRKYFRVGTFPIETAPQSERLINYLNAFRKFEDIMCFASGYPDIDTTRADTFENALPPDWRAKVMSENALEFFRWSSTMGLEKSVGTLKVREE